MPRIGPINVSLAILEDGEEERRISEYGEKHLQTAEGGPKVRCYVVSEVGKRFAINLGHSISIPPNKPKVRVVAKIIIDGTQTHHIPLARAKQSMQISTVLSSTASHRPLMFAPISRSAIANRDSSHARSKEIGSINIIVKLAEVHGISEERSVNLPGLALNPLNDSVQKQLRHHVALGDERNLRRPHVPIEIIDLSSRKYPPVVVEYAYGPREIWQSRGIIPQPQEAPSPRSFVFLPSIPGTSIRSEDRNGISEEMETDSRSMSSSMTKRKIRPLPPIPSSTAASLRSQHDTSASFLEF